MTAAETSAAVRLELAQLRRLEQVSVVEATTLIFLVGVAVPLKHFAAFPEAVKVMGPVHGLVFCFYVWTVVQTVVGGCWCTAEWLRLAVTAVVPLAGYTNLGLIRRKAAALQAELRGVS